MKNKFYPKAFERGYVNFFEVENRAIRMPMGTELGQPGRLSQLGLPQGVR